MGLVNEVGEKFVAIEWQIAGYKHNEIQLVFDVFEHVDVNGLVLQSRVVDLFLLFALDGRA